MKETFIFIGASGSGKGTQVSLLKAHLARKNPETPIFYLQTGQYFREFIKGDSLAAGIAKHAIDNGERAPDFLAMYIWSKVFVENLTGNEHLIIDGSPRSINERRCSDNKADSRSFLDMAPLKSDFRVSRVTRSRSIASQYSTVCSKLDN